MFDTIVRFDMSGRSIRFELRAHRNVHDCILKMFKAILNVPSFHALLGRSFP